MCQQRVFVYPSAIRRSHRALDARAARTTLSDRASLVRRGHEGPTYRRIHPMGKVPALRHGDIVVTEGGGDLRPRRGRVSTGGAGPRAERPGARCTIAGCSFWMFFAAGPIEAAATNRALGG